MPLPTSLVHMKQGTRGKMKADTICAGFRLVCSAGFDHELLYISDQHLYTEWSFLSVSLFPFVVFEAEKVDRR